MQREDRSVLLWPAPEHENPYTRKLATALAQRGVSVRADRRLATLCARPRGAPWLHLHWPEWMLHDVSRARYRARIGWLLSLLSLARRQGVRVAWTAHNLLGHDDPHPDLGVEAREALLARCALVLGHFAEAEGDLRALGYRGRFVCCAHPPFADEHPTCWRDASERARQRAALGVGRDDLLLVTPGSLSPYKNLPRLAEALRGVRDPSLRWIAVGSGSPEAVAQLSRAIAGDERLSLRVGFQPRDALTRMIRASDAILLGHKRFYTSGVAVLAATLGATVIAPARHQLASWASETFFFPLDLREARPLDATLARLRGGADLRASRARAFARRTDWAEMAATLDRAMFGAAA